jgi:hypothetical protein
MRVQEIMTSDAQCLGPGTKFSPAIPLSATARRRLTKEESYVRREDHRD